jgi:small-conductance mechanosensitive channel
MPGPLRSDLLIGQFLKLGDCVEVRAVFEDVLRSQGYCIGIRFSDNVSISVPTSEFINPYLINWIANDRTSKFRCAWL